MVANHINKVGSFFFICTEASDAQRRSLGNRSLLRGNCFRFHHRIQHAIAASRRAFRMLVRRKKIWALNHASQQSGIWQRQLTNVFAKVGLGRFAHAVNGKASTLTQIDLVRVHLKNLFFGEAMFQLKRNCNFNQLALEVLLRRKKKTPRQLHRNC